MNEARIFLALDVAALGEPPLSEDEVRAVTSVLQEELQSEFSPDRVLVSAELVFPRVEGRPVHAPGAVMARCQELAQEWVDRRRGHEDFFSRWGMRREELPPAAAREWVAEWLQRFGLMMPPGCRLPWEAAPPAPRCVVGGAAWRALEAEAAEVRSFWLLEWPWNVSRLEAANPPTQEFWRRLAGSERYVSDADLTWACLFDHEEYGPFFVWAER